LGLAENQVVIFMVTDGQRVTAAESIAQGVATTVLTMGWLTAWEESGFFYTGNSDRRERFCSVVRISRPILCIWPRGLPRNDHINL
jgi:hypothetical protein